MLRVGVITLGDTPDLVLVCGTGDGKMRLKLIDFKLGKLTKTMRQELLSSVTVS